MTNAQLSNEVCFCCMDVAQRTSRTDKNPDKDFFCCPKEREDGTRCTYFRWAASDLVTSKCICGRPLVVIRTKTGSRMVKCYDEEGCGYAHFFNGGDDVWDAHWVATAENNHHGVPPPVAPSPGGLSKRSRRDTQDFASARSLSPVGGYTMPSTPEGARALQEVVLDLVARVTALERTVGH